MEKENATRFKMKLCSPKMPKKWDGILSYFLSDKLCKKIIDFYRQIVDIFSANEV